MSILGELLGYDRNGYDLLGSHQDNDQNCIVCGMAAILHSRAMANQCMSKLYGGKDSTPEKGGAVK